MKVYFFRWYIVDFTFGIGDGLEDVQRATFDAVGITSRLYHFNDGAVVTVVLGIHRGYSGLSA